LPLAFLSVKAKAILTALEAATYFKKGATNMKIKSNVKAGNSVWGA
jgi:hypothetical protein